MPFGYQHPGMAWGAGFFPLIFLALVVAIVVVTMFMFSRQRGYHGHWGDDVRTPTPAPSNAEALRILDERFARGEIDADEFTTRRTLLRSSS